VNHLALRQILHPFEVRNVQRAHGLDGQSEGLIGGASSARLWQALACSPQGAQNLRPIEALTFTVVAEAHKVLSRRSRSPLGRRATVPRQPCHGSEADDGIVPEAVQLCNPRMSLP
jgi:hypothetical protein